MTSLQLNPTINDIHESATLAINQRVKHLREQGHQVHHLGFGQSPFPVPNLLQQALSEHSDKNVYLPGQGLPELTAAVAEYYQQQFSYQYKTDNVFIGPGSKELIFDLLYLLEGPLLLPSPRWVSYLPQALLCQKSVLNIPTELADNYCLQAEQLLLACRHYPKHQQKILLLSTPSNPTGTLYSADNMAEIARVCREQNIIIISDEIYAGIIFEDNDFVSPAHHCPERTIVTGGLSKLFAGGGYRLGCALLPENLPTLNKALKVLISETFSCVTTPVQYAALAAFGQFSQLQPILEQYNQLHVASSQYAYQQCQQLNLNCAKPQAAFYLFPDFTNHRATLAARDINNDKQLCDDLLEKAHVAVLPGSDFGMDSQALTVRIANVDYDGQHALKLNSLDVNQFAPSIVASFKAIGEYLR